MTKDYSVGDLVELKSGSPDMTVTAVFDEGVSVAWCGNDFDSGVMHQTELPFAAVKRVDPEPPRRDERPPSPFAISHGGHRRPAAALDDDIPF